MTALLARKRVSFNTVSVRYLHVHNSFGTDSINLSTIAYSLSSCRCVVGLSAFRRSSSRAWVVRNVASGRYFCTENRKRSLVYKSPPEANRPWTPDEMNKLYEADKVPEEVVERAKEEDAWLPIKDADSGGVYWWHPKSNATTPVGSGRPETLMRALGNSAMFGAGAAMFFALLYRVFGILVFLIMPPLTEELIRKRAEHNEGILADLEEVALHQEEIESIDKCLGERCRRIRILLLQNNVIGKLENLNKLKELEYLNVALNNIDKIEGLDRCESLRKLDLTVNFIDIENLKDSITNLECNYNLEDLYMLGNPCMDWPKARQYIVARLPSLLQLDGTLITPTERIEANRVISKLEKELEKLADVSIKRKKYEMENNIKPSKDAYTKESRLEMYREQAAVKEEKDKREKKRLGIEPKPPRVIPEALNHRGEIRQCNEGKYNFHIDEFGSPGMVVIEIDVPAYLDTSLIDVDVQPNYIRCGSKEGNVNMERGAALGWKKCGLCSTRVLRRRELFGSGRGCTLSFTELRTPCEVLVDASSVKRSKTTGALRIEMPRADRAGLLRVAAEQKAEKDGAKRVSREDLSSSVVQFYSFKFSKLIDLLGGDWNDGNVCLPVWMPRGASSAERELFLDSYGENFPPTRSSKVEKEEKCVISSGAKQLPLSKSVSLGIVNNDDDDLLKEVERGTHGDYDESDVEACVWWERSGFVGYYLGAFIAEPSFENIIRKKDRPSDLIWGQQPPSVQRVAGRDTLSRRLVIAQLLVICLNEATSAAAAATAGAYEGDAMLELMDDRHPIRTISDEDLGEFIIRKEKLLVNAKQQLDELLKRVAWQKRDVVALEGAVKLAKSEWSCRFGDGLLNQALRGAYEVLAQFLDSKDILRFGGASPSCRRLCMEGRRWKVYHFVEDEECSEMVLDWSVLYSGRIKTLEGLHHILTSAKDSLPKLARLIVDVTARDFCGAVTFDRKEFAGLVREVLGRSPNLEELDIRGRKASDLAADGVGESFPDGTCTVEPKINLRKLRVSGLPPENVMLLVGKANYANLELIDVCGPSAVAGSGSQSMWLGCTFANLQVLHLAGVGLDSGRILGDLLAGRCEKLKRLDLSDNSELGNNAFKDIMGRLKPSFKRQSTVRSSRCHPTLPALSYLNVGRCGLMGAEGGGILGKMVRYLMLEKGALEKLRIDNNQFGNEGLQNFLNHVGYDRLVAALEKGERSSISARAVGAVGQRGGELLCRILEKCKYLDDACVGGNWALGVGGNKELGPVAEIIDKGRNSSIAALLRTYYSIEPAAADIGQCKVFFKSSLCALSAFPLGDCLFDYIVETMLGDGELDAPVGCLTVVFGCAIVNEEQLFCKHCFPYPLVGAENVSYIIPSAIEDLLDVYRKRLTRLLGKMNVTGVLCTVMTRIEPCLSSRWSSATVISSWEVSEISFVGASLARKCIGSIQADPPVKVERPTRGGISLSLGRDYSVEDHISWRAGIPPVCCKVKGHHLRELKSLPRPHPVVQMIVSCLPMILFEVDRPHPWHALRQDVLSLGDELVLEMAVFSPGKIPKRSARALREVLKNLEARGIESPSDVVCIHPAAAVIFEWILLVRKAQLEVSENNTTRAERSAEFHGEVTSV
ncbi:hypothetical protein FOL47_006701 [Perkinsus chesapeaki]|uniref:Dynein axonemal assembly factor 11-like CS domain-containing protein n=1 Tax=Perkinsus chesapeaki TaxID=330153 RepID=A0A7J6MX06_PERCH|nr:hypothetical protein FOL47_006701 [Perkinsus chesapeaki]